MTTPPPNAAPDELVEQVSAIMQTWAVSSLTLDACARAIIRLAQAHIAEAIAEWCEDQWPDECLPHSDTEEAERGAFRQIAAHTRQLMEKASG